MADFLQTKNSHPRDSSISFKEEGHVYTLRLKKIRNNRIQKIKVHPTSTTTVIHLFFPKFDADKVISKMFKSGSAERNYPGMSKEEIKAKWDADGKEASELGTQMHNDIELYLNREKPKNSKAKEFKMFLNFWKDFKKEYTTAKPFRTEWLIYDTKHLISGSIDFTVKIGTTKSGQDKLILIDWKRSKEIKTTNRFETGYGPCKKLENCNFNHYSLQLNIYRHILEKNYDVKVVGLLLVVLHPSQKNYICIPIERKTRITKEIFKTILEKNGSSGDSSGSSETSDKK